jgi:hypothetical protein
VAEEGEHRRTRSSVKTNGASQQLLAFSPKVNRKELEIDKGKHEFVAAPEIPKNTPHYTVSFTNVNTSYSTTEY